MANEKLCLKDYLTCPDDDTQSKTRAKMNKKSHKGRHYGLDHGYRPEDLNGSSYSNADSSGSMAMGSTGGSGSGVSESTKQVTEMNNGILPGAFTANVLGRGAEGLPDGNADMKKQNRRNAPRKRSFAEFLKWRNSAEEEEFSDDDFDEKDDFDLDDVDDPFGIEFDDDNFDDSDFDDEQEPMNDFDRFERNQRRDPQYKQFRDEFEDDFEEPELRRAMGYRGNETFGGSENEEDMVDFDDEPDEFDDFEPEEELDFDDERDELDGGIDDEEIEDIARSTGRFVDFYRDEHQAGHDEEYPEIDDERFDDEDMDSDEFERRYDVEPHEEEEEPTGPGGFVPGQAVGPAMGGGGAGPAGQGTKIHKARVLFKQLVNNPDMARKDIINEFITQLGVTESTAVSYYERLAKEAGLTGEEGDQDNIGGEMGAGANDDMIGGEIGNEEPAPEMPQEEIDQQPPDRQGIIRHVDNAHLVYKRQMEDGGFEELWAYNIADKLDDALKIRRAILSGTDIPRGHTRSEDGQQSYTLSTMGNAQLLHITGLSN